MLGLRTAIYKVDQLEEAKAWYSKAFKTKPYFDQPFYVGFEIGGYELGLMPDSQKAAEKSANVHVLWGVEDIMTEFERLIELGATVYEEPENVGGELMVATLKDPWGNLLGLIYNPHFKTT